MTPNKKTKKSAGVALMILDPKVPFEHRLAMLGQLCMDGSDKAKAVVDSILKSAAASTGKEIYAKKIQELDKRIAELKEGPLRLASVIEKEPCASRIEVVLEDGTPVFPVLADPSLLPKLRNGEGVLVDASGKAILHLGPGLARRGDEAQFLRRIGDVHVEVLINDHDKKIYRGSDDLIEKLQNGGIEPESPLLVCQRRQMAFSVVPRQDGLSYFRYLDRSPIPDVVVDRDIGNPPPYIDELTHHIRIEMTDPGIRRRYGLRKTVMKMLTGTSGSGKTLSIEAFIRCMAEIVSDVTRTPIDDLPPRVLRLNMDQVLSMWLGESDKHLARFFDEALQLYDKPFVAADGEEYHLPVLAICEEVEALSRMRGADHEAVFDRIQTVALRRLDTTRPDYRDRVIIFLFTSNVPHLIDPAFVRRAGGTVERFGRLDRARAFRAVLDKHVRALPFYSSNGDDPRHLAREASAQITAWLYSPNGHDEGQVELTFAGSTQPLRKYRRSFMTGALVDRAVPQAATDACRAEEMGFGLPGVTVAGLARAFDEQITSIVDQLTLHNVAQYVDLPDGDRVTRIRRIEQPSALPFELMRTP